MMLVGVLGAGLVSVAWLESLARDRHVLRADEYSLALAKDALIGYSVSYPEVRNMNRGPGFLPCPDTNASGSANPVPTDCQSDTTARLPWRQLGLMPPGGVNPNRLGHFWYAADEKFRAIASYSSAETSKKVNSATRSDLKVDDLDNVAAVIIAPGSPLDLQDPSRGLNAPEEYLEGDNATSGDNEFTFGGKEDPERFDDRVVALTGDELVDAVARRVFPALRETLSRYREADWNKERVLPWLKPEDDMDPKSVATAGTRQGWLPIFNIDAKFKSDFSLRGSLEDGEISSKGSVEPESLVLPENGLDVEDGECVWRSPKQVKCEGKAHTSLPDDGVRVYEFDISLEGDPEVIAPTASDIRRRRVVGEKWTDKSTVEISEHTDEPPTQDNRTRQGSISFSKDALIAEQGAGSLAVEDIAFPLSVGADSDPDLPAWLPRNDWHLLLWVDIASPFAIAGSGDCSGEGGCLSVSRVLLDGRRTSFDPAAVVFLLAGSKIDAVETRNTDNFIRSEWFEGRNAVDDGRYEMRPRAPDFNDRIGMIYPVSFRD